MFFLSVQELLISLVLHSTLLGYIVFFFVSFSFYFKDLDQNIDSLLHAFHLWIQSCGFIYSHRVYDTRIQTHQAVEYVQ